MINAIGVYIGMDLINSGTPPVDPLLILWDDNDTLLWDDGTEMDWDG